MSKVICDVCGTSYPETADQCPICGCARADGGQTSAGDTLPEGEGTSTYTYVKGGRFSKANVRKRNKANQALADQAERAAVQEYDADDDDEQDYDQEVTASNKWLIAIVVVLLLAIIAVSSYIAIRFFGLGGSNDPTTDTNSTQSTQATEPTAGTTAPTAPSVPCTGLILTDGAVELKSKDSAWKLNVTIEPANTTDEVIYQSSDGAVATVSADGTITAVGAGEAVITITCGSQTAQCSVKCTFESEQPSDPTDPSQPSDSTDPTDPSDTTEPSEVIVLELNRDDFTLSRKGESWQLYRGEIPNADITWTSDDPSIATVENGRVVAVSVGQTIIRAEYQGQVDTCIVRCRWEEVKPTEPTEPSEPVDPSDPSDATEPSEPGETTEPSETTEPTEPPTVYTIMINGLKPTWSDGPNHADTTCAVGDDFTLTVEDDIGARKEVTWVASNPDLCTIEGRNITCVAAGKTELTCEYEGVTYIVVLRIVEASV